MRIEYGMLSDQGKVRASNEDSFIVDGDAGVFVVADGMGGHAAGEVASRIAAGAVKEFLESGDPGADLRDLLHHAVQHANTRVYEAQRARTDYCGMGTTLTALVLRRQHYYVAQVGDSRAYLCRERRLQQLTRDHSLVWPLFEGGLLSKDQIARHPQKHLITRSIGTHPEVHEDMYSDAAQVGDLFLLCSDGLTDVLADQALERILTEAGKSPREISRNLIDCANAGGGPDNITAIVVRLTDKS